MIAMNFPIAFHPIMATHRDLDASTSNSPARGTGRRLTTSAKSKDITGPYFLPCCFGSLHGILIIRHLNATWCDTVAITGKNRGHREGVDVLERDSLICSARASDLKHTYRQRNRLF